MTLNKNVIYEKDPSQNPTEETSPLLMTSSRSHETCSSNNPNGSPSAHSQIPETETRLIVAKSWKYILKRAISSWLDKLVFSLLTTICIYLIWHNFCPERSPPDIVVSSTNFSGDETETFGNGTSGLGYNEPWDPTIGGCVNWHQMNWLQLVQFIGLISSALLITTLLYFALVVAIAKVWPAFLN